MSILPIAIVILVVAMLIGPIMLMQPSKYQRRVASLRQKAAQLGVQVHMSKYGEEQVAAYQMPWRPSRRKRGHWQLTRASYEHGLHLAGVWQWMTQQRPSPEFEKRLAEHLPQLPASVVGVEGNARGLVVLWRERGGDQQLLELIEWLKTVIESDESLPATSSVG